MLSSIYTYYFIQHEDKNWNTAFLADISNMYQPKTISEKELISDGEYNVYGANGIIGKYNAFNHKEPQIAVACRGASCGALTMTLPYSWITGNAMVISENKQFPYKEFLYYTLKHKPISYLTSGSAQPQLTRENMSIYPIKIPPQELLDKFETRAKSYRQKIIANLLENQKLRDLRDWLLPMLMNGQATISD